MCYLYITNTITITALHSHNAPTSGVRAGEADQCGGGHVLVEREAGRRDAAVALLPHTGACHEEV